MGWQEDEAETYVTDLNDLGVVWNGTPGDYLNGKGTMADTTTATDVVRLSVNLNKETADALKKWAEQRNVSLTEAVRRAISVYDFIEGEVEEGNRIQIRNKYGNVRELVLM